MAKKHTGPSGMAPKRDQTGKRNFHPDQPRPSSLGIGGKYRPSDPSCSAKRDTTLRAGGSHKLPSKV
jgi:hypothetical protein